MWDGQGRASAHLNTEWTRSLSAVDSASSKRSRNTPGTWAYRLLVLVVLGFLPLVGAVVATYRVPRSIQRRATYWVYAVSLFLFCLAWAAGGTFLTYLLGA